MKHLLPPVCGFQDEFRWLSNFWPAAVLLDGSYYPSVENAYQAAKTHQSERTPFKDCSASAARRLGRMIPVRSGFHEQRVEIMEGLVFQKFASGTALAARLIATGARELIEENHWGDVFWGRCRGEGQNKLGEILMAQRERLLNDGKDLGKAVSFSLAARSKAEIS